MQFDNERSRSFGTPPYFYVLLFRVLALGVPVQDAAVTFVVNNGNLVAFSVAVPPAPPPRAVPVISRAVVESLAAADLVCEGRIHRPEFRDASLAWRLSGGIWTKAWQGVVRDGSTGILYWVVTSAETGRVLEVRSLRADGQATGGVRLRLRSEPQTLMPLRGVTVSDGVNEEVTDAAGRFSLSGNALSGTLSGPYATVTDGCGSDGVTGDSSGLAFGATLRTDCAPGAASAPGDTSAARTSSWHVNRIRDLYRAYDAQVGWLDTPAIVWTNVMSECVNYFDGENIFLNWNGGSTLCANAGEDGEEVDHEWGHAYQFKAWGFADPATREAYANVTSLLQFHNHCIGSGFWVSTTLGATPCSGFQETDFNAWDPPLPATPQGIGGPPYFCPPDTSQDGGGIAGYEGHCEGHIMTQAMYELGVAFAQKYGAATGWDKLLRLWIAAGPLQGHGWEVTDPGPPIAGDGCAPSNWFESLRIADDDNGDLSDGVPDGAEIYQAFANHGIACPSDPHVTENVTTCPSIAPPSVIVAYQPASDSVLVSWSPIAGATGYRVLRSELGPEGAFTPIAVTGPGETSFIDPDGTSVALHWYAVVALGAGNCESSLSPVAPSTTCVPAVGLAEPLNATVTDPASTTLSWTLGANAEDYELFLSPGPEPRHYLTTASTSYLVPAGSLAPGSTYWWKVEGGNSVGACAPAVSEVRSFTVPGTAMPPSPTGAQPDEGFVGGGTLVTISGTNLFLGATVTFGGIPGPVTSWGDGSALTVTAPPHAAGVVEVVVTNPGGLAASVPGGFEYVAPVSSRFYPVTPCRVVDTRSGIDPVVVKRGTFLDDEVRAYTLADSTDCPGLPSDATAWLVNIQLRPVTQASYLIAFPDGISQPAVSTLVASPDRWRVNNAIVPAGPGGTFDVYCQYAARVVIDVSGYFK